MAMDVDYRERFFDRRAALLEEILRYVRTKGIKGKDFWTLRRGAVRFSLGESDYDLKVPFIFGGGCEEIFDEAMRELASLLKGRLEPSMVYDNRGGLMISMLDERVHLLPRGYRITNDFPGRIEAEIAASTLYGDPYIDAGLIKSWLVPSLYGRRLIAELFRIYKKAIEQEMRLSGTERTSFLVHLAIAKILTEKKEIIKGVRIRGVSYEKLERSVSILFANIVTAVVTETLGAFKKKLLSYDFREMEYLLLGTSTPFFVLNIKNAILASDLNPYNLTPRIAAHLEEVYNQAAPKCHSIGDLTSGMVDLIMQDKIITEAVFDFHSISSFRDDIIDYLTAYDNQREGIHILLTEIAQDDKLLRAMWEDSKIASKVEAGLSELIDRYHRDDRRIQKIKKILTNFKTHRKWGLIRLFSIGKDTIVFKISEVVRRYIIYRMDLGYDSYFTVAKKALENRKRLVPLKELIREYEEGRLYRFSGDHKVLLVKKEEMKEGHLFVDLKGFTKRTRKSGSLVMADFLKNEFFLPILNAAKRYYLKVGDEPSLGLELNNLLGDAVSFSGNIIALVELAKEIQIITAEYKKKLVKDHPDLDERILRERLTAEYRHGLVELESEKKRIADTIRELNRIIEGKRSISPKAMVDAQMKVFEETIQHYIDEIAEASQRVRDATSDKDRETYLNREMGVRGQLVTIKESKDELVGEVTKQGLIRRSKEFYSQICQDELNQIERLKGLLNETHKKVRELTQSYYDRLGEITDRGVSAGLYISYGGVSEGVTIHDDLWGDIKVRIADKINEASRGSQRHRGIKKRIDRFLENKRLETQNQNLIYPFNVIIGSTLAIIQPIDEEDNRFTSLVQTIFKSEEELLLGTAERAEPDLISEIQLEDQYLMEDEFVSESTDIYNLGEALSEDALREYIRGSRDRLYFFDRRVHRSEFNPEFHNIFAYDGTEIYLIFGVEQKTGGRHVEIFRHAGVLDYTGTLKREVTEVYEIIRPDSPFYLFIMDQHFQAWYDRSRTAEDVREGLLGT
jgi:hypothetical protein